MTVIPAHFRLPMAPVAAAAAVVVQGPLRLTVLTARLLRLEYSPTGTFEDHASQVFWHRLQPVPLFHITLDDTHLTLTTEALRLHTTLPATLENLTITLLDSGHVWHYGATDQGNLMGTARTLDGISGDTVLEPGLLSRSGWTVIDDSASLVFNEHGWLEPRTNPTNLDLYFFGYGQEYLACLQDFQRLCGRVPLIPRYILGNWWSRYWAYTQTELTNLLREFRAHDIPLSICIIDMDWHLTNISPENNGWTGYTWNRTLFPDPPGFINWLHENKLRTALNLHPALGVWPHEEAYPAFARLMNLDPSTPQPIPFALADPQFAQGYFELLHHPQEANGVDFWWIDWQQGTTTALAGLDPLWWLNHLHFYDLGRDGKKRPFIFSRWGGPGNHRYPIGFSGDTHVDWPSLAFQPAFTATAANVGYSWWSHDIGGHQEGVEEPELYARWVQFGLFSPILRLHSAKTAFLERRPWLYDAETYHAVKKAMQLRHAFIPYLYTMAWRNEMDGKALVRPLYHDYPHEEAAYDCPQQYLFGSELLVSPYTDPMDMDVRLSRQAVWLPQGDWYHFFNGTYYKGGRTLVTYGSLADIPVFAKAGAIVPLGPEVSWGGTEIPTELHVHIFAGADGHFDLFEDDGETVAYQEGDYCLTPLEVLWWEKEMVVIVNAAAGQTRHLPPQRDYTFYLVGLKNPDILTVQVDGIDRPFAYGYDETRECLTVMVLGLPVTASCRVVAWHADGLLARRNRLQETLSYYLRTFRLETNVKSTIAWQWANIQTNPTLLDEYPLTSSQREALLDLIDSLK
ncbi:MAG: TIM-barrel domain-containing protein [Candidatus Promineifilaceae bacterium]